MPRPTVTTRKPCHWGTHYQGSHHGVFFNLVPTGPHSWTVSLDGADRPLLARAIARAITGHDVTRVARYGFSGTAGNLRDHHYYDFTEQ